MSDFFPQTTGENYCFFLFRLNWHHCCWSASIMLMASNSSRKWTSKWLIRAFHYCMTLSSIIMAIMNTVIEVRCVVTVMVWNYSYECEGFFHPHCTPSLHTPLPVCVCVCLWVCGCVCVCVCVCVLFVVVFPVFYIYLPSKFQRLFFHVPRCLLSQALILVCEHLHFVSCRWKIRFNYTFMHNINPYVLQDCFKCTKFDVKSPIYLAFFPLL